MNHNLLFISFIIFPLFTTSCGVSKCPQQSEETIISGYSTREAFSLFTTALISGGDWCSVEKNDNQIWEESTYTRYSIYNSTFGGLSVKVFQTNDQAKEYLSNDCKEITRFHNLLACKVSNQSTYDKYSKHYSISSSIAWVSGRRYFIAGVNYLGTYSTDIPIPNTEAELLYYISILSGLIPFISNEYFQILLFIICIVIIILLIRKILFHKNIQHLWNKSNLT